MDCFRAERLIYGKLAGMDREYEVVGQSVHWPSAGGVPKCVGFPGDVDFAGACSLDWHPCPTEHLLALSWCEPGPRITRRDFFQVHHLVARPAEFAHVLPFLPEIVAQMRQIPIFYASNLTLPSFVFEYAPGAVLSAENEAWFRHHWFGLSLVLTALFADKSVFIRNYANVEENLKIIAGLMLILPLYLRAHMTFSTDEFARRPYKRRVTFSHNNGADVEVDWQSGLLRGHDHSVTHPVVTKWGRILAQDGLTAMLDDTRRSERHYLSFDDLESASQI